MNSTSPANQRAARGELGACCIGHRPVGKQQPASLGQHSQWSLPVWDRNKPPVLLSACPESLKTSPASQHCRSLLACRFVRSPCHFCFCIDRPAGRNGGGRRTANVVLIRWSGLKTRCVCINLRKATSMLVFLSMELAHIFLFFSLIFSLFFLRFLQARALGDEWRTHV
jgi:hypothetical protein